MTWQLKIEDDVIGDVPWWHHGTGDD